MKVGEWRATDGERVGRKGRRGLSINDGGWGCGSGHDEMRGEKKVEGVAGRNT